MRKHGVDDAWGARDARLLLLTEAEEQAAGVGVGDDRLDAAREVLAVGDEEAAAVALGVHPAVVLPTPHQLSRVWVVGWWGEWGRGGQ